MAPSLANSIFQAAERSPDLFPLVAELPLQADELCVLLRRPAAKHVSMLRGRQASSIGREGGGGEGECEDGGQKRDPTLLYVGIGGGAK